MQLTSLLERSSTLVIKLGMPLVYAYHLICSNTFLNVAAEDAHGLEKAANYALIPYQYLFEGKRALPDNELAYRFERRFAYDDHFFIRTASSVATLPLSLIVGGGLKAAAFCFEETRARHRHLLQATKTPIVHSNLECYRCMGLAVNDYMQAESIPMGSYQRRPGDAEKLQADIEALGTIVKLLHDNQILFWLDCGSCLGAYRYSGAIPWDWDIDIAVLSPDFANIKRVLGTMDPEKYCVQDWSGRDRPETYLKVFVRENGGMIDIYHFGLDPEKQELHTILSNEFNIFLPDSWKQRELRYTHPMPFSRVFPLKKALFEGIEVPVPGQIEEYLRGFYGANLAPARIYSEITQAYEKDLSHPYWQEAHVH